MKDLKTTTVLTAIAAQLREALAAVDEVIAALEMLSPRNHLNRRKVRWAACTSRRQAEGVGHLARPRRIEHHPNPSPAGIKSLVRRRNSRHARSSFDKSGRVVYTAFGGVR